MTVAVPWKGVLLKNNLANTLEHIMKVDRTNILVHWERDTDTKHEVPSQLQLGFYIRNFKDIVKL